MITWHELSTQQKIDQIVLAHKSGQRMSATNISVFINTTHPGSTRNSIIGMYGRHRSKLIDFPLDGLHYSAPAALPKAPKAEKAEKAKRIIRSEKVRKTLPPAPKPAALPEPIPLGKELWELEAGECKWPVHGEGSKALFCACQADRGKPYCPYHTERALGKGVRIERLEPKPQSLRPSSLMRRITGTI